MRAVLLDKVGSVTLNCGLRRDVRLADTFACKEGDVLAVRILNAKTSYNTLELTTGRMSSLKPGDVIAGALGHRNALLGYSGVIPKTLNVGNQINLLNMGGVLGNCTSFSPAVGPPFECEVLGQVLDFPTLGSRKGVPANIAANLPPFDEALEVGKIPIVAVAGTLMNSGKTEACTALIQQFTRMGLKVAAIKTTGVSLRRDVLAMEDAGAGHIAIFTEFGVVTTQRSNAAGLTRSMLNRMASLDPDLIIVELGDGLMGDYGVDAIFEATDLAQSVTKVVLAANDPVGAWGGVRLLEERYQVKTAAVTGPATDNMVGTRAIERETGVLAINARQNAEALAKALHKELEVTHAK